MRRRRVERLMVRAEGALRTGNTDEVREALEEARRLAPGLAQIAALETALQVSVEPPTAPALPTHASPETEATSLETHRRTRWMPAAAAAFALVITGASLWTLGGSGDAEDVAAQATTPSTSVDQQAAQSTTDSARSSAADDSARVRIETVEAAPVQMLSPAPPPPPEVPPLSPTQSAAVQQQPAVPVATSGAGTPLPQTRDLEVSQVALPEGLSSVAALDAPPAPAVVEARNVIAAPVPAPRLSASSSKMDRVAEPAAPAVTEDAAVRGVLNRYAVAYSRLDASAAQEVWPAVNRSALSRAFDGLASQQVSLERCAVDVRGATANATCAGSATWSPKIGNGGARTEARNWTFQLAKAGTAWQIVSARVQNQNR